MRIVAGAGPGNPECLTKEVHDAIIQAKKVLAFGRIKESFDKIRKDIIFVKSVDEACEEIKKSNDVLILVSGDPCFFGIVDLLKRRGVKLDKILPGISAVQYFASRLQIPWSNACVKSFHGRELELGSLNSSVCFFFTDSKNTPQKIGKALAEAGYAGKLYIGYRLSYPDEKIISTKIGKAIETNNSISIVGVVLDENIKR
ncbi:MAG: precorrin-6y C5,15-methyltransferase (decarboxylating) subunit CbiE [Treponemataceae bacterium]